MAVMGIRKILRRGAVCIVWASAFFLLGYFSVTLIGDVRVGLVILAGGAIPFGITARSALRGLGRGVGLGLAAAAGIIWGMLVARAAPPESFDRIAVTYAVSAMFLASAAASLFAALAQRRRQMIERSWQD